MNFFNKPQKPLRSDIINVRVNFNTLRIADFEEEDKHLFIEVINELGNTLLDFYNAGNYTAYCYNNKGYLDTQHIAFNNTNRSFIIGTQYKSILLWRH